jgi:hypothetical protein
MDPVEKRGHCIFSQGTHIAEGETGDDPRADKGKKDPAKGLDSTGAKSLPSVNTLI